MKQLFKTSNQGLDLSLAVAFSNTYESLKWLLSVGHEPVKTVILSLLVTISKLCKKWRNAIFIYKTRFSHSVKKYQYVNFNFTLIQNVNQSKQFQLVFVSYKNLPKGKVLNSIFKRQVNLIVKM